MSTLWYVTITYDNDMSDTTEFYAERPARTYFDNYPSHGLPGRNPVGATLSRKTTDTQIIEDKAL